MLEVFGLLTFRSIKIFAVLHYQVVGDFLDHFYTECRKKGNLEFVVSRVFPNYVNCKNISILELFKNNLMHEEQFFSVSFVEN